MSLFGSLMGDFEDDMFMGNHMQAMNMQMRSMNRLMNSMMMPDPFNMLAPFDNGFQQNQLMERGSGMGHMGLFGFPAMPNMNRLLNADISAAPGGAAYCSSSVVTMSSGPDGRPQIYQATSSTKTGPGGIRETRKTVQDSTSGVKKMAIGHHIGERSHIIEKEQDLRSGQLEERQEFINLEEEEAEDFDREFTNKARGGRHIMPPRAQEVLTIEDVDDDEEEQAVHNYKPQQRRQLPALPPAPSEQNNSSPQAQTTRTTTTATTTKSTPTSSTLSSSSSLRAAANASATNAAAAANYHHHIQHNLNNNYLSATPRRAYRSHLHHTAGVSPRRPLRTPTSSPLATTPTNPSLSTATTSRDWRLYNPRFYRSK